MPGPVNALLVWAHAFYCSKWPEVDSLTMFKYVCYELCGVGRAY